MGKEIHVTQEGLEKLRAELEELKGPVRLAIADAIREAKSHGDLRENAAYHEAKLNQTRLDKRIADLERVLQAAKVAEVPTDGGAHIGSTVKLLDLEFDDEFTIKLVGAFEADPANDLISVSSPMGEALVGAKDGDEVEVSAPAGVTRYRVLSVQTG